MDLPVAWQNFRYASSGVLAPDRQPGPAAHSASAVNQPNQPSGLPMPRTPRSNRALSRTTEVFASP